MTHAFTIPAGHASLDGHFPGHPIVPAVVLLAEVMSLLESETALPASAWTLTSAKFLMPVAPGTPLHLDLDAATAGVQRFAIRGPQGLVASGSLAPGAAA